MTTKQANRLLQLAHTLRNAPAHLKFDMAVSINQGKISPAHPCGTAACAMGFLPVAFPKTFKVVPCNEFGTVGIPRYCKTGEYFDLNEFFGIRDDEDAGWLFGADHTHRTAADEARVIEAFVRKKGFHVTEVA